MKTSLTRSLRLLAMATALASCVVAAPAAMAQSNQVTPTLQTYFVSMLLQLKTDPVTVKQVHAVVSETTPDLAEETFLKTVKRDYPNYNVLDTLTSPATGIVPPKCVKTSLGVMI